MTAPAVVRPYREVLADGFWARVQKTTTCWLWLGNRKPNGYGRYGGKAYAHRYAYECLVGPIPEGLTIDHLCRIRNCVNPAHMETVTQRVNVLRGGTLAARHANAVQCPRRHPYDASNTYYRPNGGRDCRQCRAAVQRTLRANRRKGVAGG